MNIDPCKLIQFPTVSEASRGKLTFLEYDKHIPFEIKRIFYIYEIPADISRADHAHKNFEEVIIPIHGSFTVSLDNAREKTELKLDSPSVGLYIPSKIWLKLSNFAPGTICIALVSEFYDKADYYSNYEEFRGNRG